MIDPIKHIPKEFHLNATDVNFLIPSKFPCKPFYDEPYFSIHFYFEHSPTTLDPNLVFGSQELSPGYIIPASKHVLSPWQQSWLANSASHNQPGVPPSQLIEKITEKEFELAIARDGDVEARVGVGGVVGELGPSEVPVELDSLATMVGRVDGFGAGTGSEKGESWWVERDGDGERVGCGNGEGVGEEGFGPGEGEIGWRVAEVGLVDGGYEVLMRHLRAAWERVGLAETCWNHGVQSCVCFSKHSDQLKNCRKFSERERGRALVLGFVILWRVIVGFCGTSVQWERERERSWRFAACLDLCWGMVYFALSLGKCLFGGFCKAVLDCFKLKKFKFVLRMWLALQFCI
jgi:hypothetical protein